MPPRFLTAIRAKWRKRFGVIPMRASLNGLRQWFSSPLGRALLEEETCFFNEHLSNLFGYHLLQLSVIDDVCLMDASRISHKFALYPQSSAQMHVSAVVDYNHLPLPADAIDVVLLHHALDYSQNPHHLLREASRVLIPNGHLILVGFNPWSLLGLGRFFARLLRQSPQWRHQSLRLGRVLDWLAVLDMEPIFVRQGFYRPPLQANWSVKYLHWLEYWGKRLCLPWGGFYFIVARKDCFAVVPLQPEWQGRVALRGWGVIKILGRTARYQPNKNIKCGKSIENS
jgi:SAM-dependent methyltransferase